MSLLTHVPASLKNRINLFYILAFAPILLIIYFNVLGVVIPFYGFLLFLFKKEKLNSSKAARSLQRFLGFVIILGSFFVYYVLVPLFPFASFYGAPNYAMYLLGLFLAFFDYSFLKEAFTPLFLIVAATSSSIISLFAEPYLTPYLVPFSMSVITTILGALGIEFTTHSRVIVLQTWKGPLPLVFVWGCVGFYSTLVFSIILVVLLFEDTSSLKTKIAWSAVGIIGTLTVNIIRLITIFLTDYYYGADVGAQVHYFIGYLLFIAWLAIFLYAFSKKHIFSKILFKK